MKKQPSQQRPERRAPIRLDDLVPREQVLGGAPRTKTLFGVVNPERQERKDPKP